MTITCAVCALLGLGRHSSPIVTLVQGTAACPDHVSLLVLPAELAIAVRTAAADIDREPPRGVRVNDSVTDERVPE